MAESTSSPGPTSPASAARATTVTTPGQASPVGSPAIPSTAAPTPAAEPANTGFLEADENAEYDDDAATEVSATTSIRSFLLTYRMQNGRTYHAYQEEGGDGEFKPYFMPNDQPENERLDLQHHLMMLVQDDQIFTCPHVKQNPPKRVFDAGTGTGIWALDFGDQFPESSVVGTDLSRIQPIMVAPNVEFFIDDLEADWTFVRPFDFIYARFLTGSIKNWPRFFSQAFEHMNPGGWLETCDIVSPVRCDDGTLPANSALLKWNNILLEASIRVGAPGNSVNHYEQQMADAGFENVTKVEYKWPINTWPKDTKHKKIGKWSHMNMMSALHGLSMMLFTQVMGWSAAEVQVLLADVRKDMKNIDIHAYWPIWVIYGQKPE